MMDFLKLFDKFHLVTRCGPAFVCVLPFVEIFVVKSWSKGNISEMVFLAITLLVLILSLVVRDCGKKEEKRIVSKLGGYPTTISLRWSDTRINELSKARYHNVLHDVWGFELPKSLQDEKGDLKKSDIQYDAAVDKLRVYANLKQADFPLVEKSLELYNFWRNLFGSRRLFYGVTVVALIYIIGVECACFCVSDWNWLMLVRFCEADWYVLILLLLVQLCLFCNYVNESRVIDHAFNYAKTLLEVLAANKDLEDKNP